MGNGGSTMAEDLLAYLAASPSPFHAVATTRARLQEADWVEVDEAAPLPRAPGRYLVIRDGSLVAWDTSAVEDIDGFRIVGAHTDSPNLRLAPRPDTGRAGWQQLDVEVYGGALWNSWLDRDLGISGRAVVRDPSVSMGRRSVLFACDEPLARIPQLAIHLDRTVNSEGLRLNAHTHLVPVWGLGPPTVGAFETWLGEQISVEPSSLLGWEAMLHDVAPASILGRHGEFISSARLDNLVSCHAGSRALQSVEQAHGVPVLCLFDHEEIGSQSASGADSPLLATTLERICLAADLDRSAYLGTLRRSWCLSADGAHATHPNYPERHDADHPIVAGAGPVLKVNANVRYATDAPGAALVADIARRADVDLQQFVSRSDMPCGSTIGPVTAARLGVPTVDVGVAQLSMHSIRELCAASDVDDFAALLTAFFSAR